MLSLQAKGLGTKNQIAMLVGNAGGLDTAFTEGLCGVINSAIFYPALPVYRSVKVNSVYFIIFNKRKSIYFFYFAFLYICGWLSDSA